MRNFLFAASVFGLFSCAAVPQKSYLLNSCYKVAKEAGIYKAYDNIYVGEYLASTLLPTRLIKSSKPVGKLKAGQKVELVEILKGSSGSFSAFFRPAFKVFNGELAGLVFDVPGCVSYHPKDKWVKGCPLNSNDIVFNEEFIEACAQ